LHNLLEFGQLGFRQFGFLGEVGDKRGQGAAEGIIHKVAHKAAEKIRFGRARRVLKKASGLFARKKTFLAEAFHDVQDGGADEAFARAKLFGDLADSNRMMVEDVLENFHFCPADGAFSAHDKYLLYLLETTSVVNKPHTTIVVNMFY
jgi:hypothetical protein